MGLEDPFPVDWSPSHIPEGSAKENAKIQMAPHKSFDKLERGIDIPSLSRLNGHQ
jgi:hypothetical protein